MQARKPDALHDAEARVRALTFEVGTLREELKRESRRKERAVLKAKEVDDARQTLEHQINELRYSNKRLKQEVEAAQGSARGIAERNRSALQRLQEGLAAVESAVEGRSREAYQRVQVMFGLMQRLQQVLFPAAASPNQSHSYRPAVAMELRSWGVPAGTAMPADAAHLIGEVFRVLSALGALLTSAAGEQPPGVPGSPGVAAAESSAAALLPGQEMQHLCERVAQLSQRLQEASSDKLVLQNQVADLEQQLQSLTSGPQAALSLAAVAELEADRAQLAAEVQQLREQLRRREQVVQQVEALQDEVAMRQAQLQGQQREIEQLRSSISAQQEDIRSALSLVTYRGTAAAAAAAAGAQRQPALQQLGSSLAIGENVSSAKAGISRGQTSYLDPTIRSPRPWLAYQHKHQQSASPVHDQRHEASSRTAAGTAYIPSAYSSPCRPGGLLSSPPRSADAAQGPTHAVSPVGMGQLTAWRHSSSPSRLQQPPAVHSTHKCLPGSLAAAQAPSPARPVTGAAPVPCTTHHITRIKLDMQSLDAEIADLEASLEKAAKRLS